jgi:hypothetical protein
LLLLGPGTAGWLLRAANKQSNASIRERAVTLKMDRDGRFLSRFRGDNVGVHKWGRNT